MASQSSTIGCPCGANSELIQKVSVLYRQASIETQRAGPSVDPVSPELATFLAPPMSPQISRFRNWRWAFSLLALPIIALGWMATLLSLFLQPDFGELVRTNSSYSPGFLALDLILISGTFAGTGFLVVYSLYRHRRSEAAAQRGWGQSLGSWNQAFYCRTCQGVFEAGSPGIESLPSFAARMGHSAPLPTRPAGLPGGG